MDGWAIDLGTTNTGVSPAGTRRRASRSSWSCRRSAGSRTATTPWRRRAWCLRRCTCSRTRGCSIGWAPGHPSPDASSGAAPRSSAGRPWSATAGSAHPAFVPTFKHALTEDATAGRSPGSAAARSRHGRWRAPFCASCWPRSSAPPVAASASLDGHRPGLGVRDLPRGAAAASPSDLGVRRLRFLDEPVAAALGYGLNLAQERTVLVVDIGGGTMHVVLVRMSPGGAMAGQAEVLGKQVRPLGGNTVDGWVLMDFCEQLGVPLMRRRLGRHAILATAHAGRGVPRQGGGLLRRARRRSTSFRPAPSHLSAPGDRDPGSPPHPRPPAGDPARQRLLPRARGVSGRRSRAGRRRARWRRS